MIPPKILIIAGSDSGGGAGIQADIKAVTMLGGHAMTAITALTAQNTLGVEAVMTVPVEMVLKQIDVVVSDLGVDAVKIGMIGSPETAEAVAERLAKLDQVPVVFDPVMVASSGAELADEATVAAFRKLIAVSAVVTPNAPELEVLSGRRIENSEDMEAAALALAREAGIAVLAKGGHVRGAVVVDALVEKDGTVTRWEGPRVETMNTHGTGCTLASGLATGLGQTRALADSATRARDYVKAAIANAPGFGKGHGPIGHTLGTVPFALIHKIVE
ncbi:MAG TPA: bifunctional hydroxymethylpyrimidine kinase/phosphomethylpyrimidine kinase [Allosphingosinicella sp.]|nr:bifunctional hydroxymethylpyrimidine kinase/phosphomethylpyrimidine kinase [Allosphingosinicella sp.]